MTKFSVIGRTAKGNQDFKIESPRLFRDQMTDLHGHFILTVEKIEDKGTELQLWHFRKVVIPLVIKLSNDTGMNMSEDEAEVLILHEVCKIPTERNLEDLKKSEISVVIDAAKRWINQFFGETRETTNKII